MIMQLACSQCLKLNARKCASELNPYHITRVCEATFFDILQLIGLCNYQPDVKALRHISVPRALLNLKVLMSAEIPIPQGDDRTLGVTLQNSYVHPHPNTNLTNSGNSCPGFRGGWKCGPGWIVGKDRGQRLGPRSRKVSRRMNSGTFGGSSIIYVKSDVLSIFFLCGIVGFFP